MKKSILFTGIAAIICMVLMAIVAVLSFNFGIRQASSSENVNIVLSTNDDGYYNIVGDVAIEYAGDRIHSISISDPTLHAFQVSSRYNGGIWLLDMDEGQGVIDELTSLAEDLRSYGYTESADLIDSVIETLSGAGPLTGSST